MRERRQSAKPIVRKRWKRDKHRGVLREDGRDTRPSVRERQQRYNSRYKGKMAETQNPTSGKTRRDTNPDSKERRQRHKTLCEEKTAGIQKPRRKKQVIQGSHMVSGTRCPAWSDQVEKWSGSRADVL